MMCCLENCVKEVRVYEIGDNLTCVLHCLILFLIILAIIVAVCYYTNKKCEKEKHTERLNGSESIRGRLRKDCVYGEYEIVVRENKDASKGYYVSVRSACERRGEG